MKLPQFSIVTICRNEVDSIRATCDSICTQTFRDFEWMVVDGGSTDGTLEILKEYEGDIHCLISESDSGIYNAMNKGAVNANGKYLIFMNGGDCFASSDALLSASQAPDAKMLYGDIYLGDRCGNLITYPDYLGADYMLSNRISHQATFYARDVFELAGGYDESFQISADYDLYVRLLKLQKISYYHIPHPIAIFDLKGVSNRGDFRSLKKQENHRVRKKYFKKYRQSWKCWRQEIRGLLRSGS
jgi:glycosyltransferase involved in cell wall biosynthesis